MAAAAARRAAAAAAAVRAAAAARAVPFQLGAAEARQRFCEWSDGVWLAPRGAGLWAHDARIVSNGGGDDAGGGLRAGESERHASDSTTVRAAMLPFWAFDATVDVSYSGEVGRAVGGGGSAGGTSGGGGASDGPAVHWSDVPSRGSVGGVRYAALDHEALQVYAGYRERRDLAAAARLGGTGRPRELLAKALNAHPARARQAGGGADADDADASAGSGGIAEGPAAGCATASAADIDDFEMGRGMAWGFALRHIFETEVAASAARLKKEYATEHVRNVTVTLSVRERRASALLLPLYSARYRWSTKFSHGESVVTVPSWYRAAVGGAVAGVAAQRHLCPYRSGLSAAGALAAALGSVQGALMLASPELAAYALAHFGIEAATTSVVLTGLGSSLFTQMHQPQDHHDAASGAKSVDPQVSGFKNKTARHKRWFRETRSWRDSSVEGSAHASSQAAAQLLRAREAVEWEMFEQDERRSANGDTKRMWAESLLKEQVERRASVRAQQRQRHEEARRAAEDKARERMRARQDHGSRSRGGGGRAPRWGSMGGRAGAEGANVRDVHGYYKRLGVPPGATASEIKAAFRKQALECHPDTAGDDPASVLKFHKLEAAYRVLEDPRLRKLYDTGRAPPPP